MKRALIHRGYFRELFRQLRTKGLVGTIILAGLNLIIFSVLIMRDPVSASVTHYDPRLMALPMLLFLYVMSPIMVFGAFRWLNKRVQSDFYHALALTRVQTYASTAAAIFLWILIALGSYAVVNVLLFTIFGLPINYLLYLCVFLNMLIAAIEIVSAFMIGSALCGRRFAAFFQSVTVLFLPRLLLTAFWMFVEGDSGCMTPFSMLPFFLNPEFNIAATPIHSLLFGINYANIAAMLYSLGYGALLLTLGCIAFKKRKSELAENPYASKVLQTAARVVFGMPQLIAVIVILNLTVCWKYDMQSFERTVLLPLIVTAVFFSFVFYCLYELISTKKMKPVLKAMPFYTICIALALFYIFVPNWVAKSRTPAVLSQEEIRSYQVNGESTLLMPNSLTGAEQYPDYLLHRHRFDLLKGKALVAAQSQKNAKIIDYSDFYDTLVVVRDGGLFKKTVAMKPTSAQRSEEQLKKLCLEDPAFREALASYPKGMIRYQCEGLTAAEAKEVGRLFREDFAKLSEEQRLSLTVGSNKLGFPSAQNAATDLTVTLYVSRGTDNFYAVYRINELTPNAAKAMLKYLNARYEKNVRAALREFVNWMEHPSGMPENDSFYIGNHSVQVYSLLSFEDSKKNLTPMETHPEVYQILKALSEAPLAEDAENCVTIQFMNYTMNFTGIVSANDFRYPTAGFKADDSLMRAIMQMISGDEFEDFSLSYEGV